MNKLTDTFQLSNGYSIPCVGFGTWKTPDGETAISSVRHAIACGYRHIDTAAVYRNEAGVGQGIAEGGVDRKDLFVTSKVWNTERGYDKTLRAFDKTLSDLKTDYLDLYLIHWPANAKNFPDWDKINQDTWKAMTKLYKDGRVRAIGLSNFLPHHMKSLMDAEVRPMIDQIEFHPGFTQPETVAFCKENGILVEAWSPLGNGRVLENDLLVSLAQKYNRSVAQLCVRWCLQHETLPLPKSVTPSRIEENARIFDFEISKEDMEKIDSLSGVGASGLYPDEVDF